MKSEFLPYRLQLEPPATKNLMLCLSVMYVRLGCILQNVPPAKYYRKTFEIRNWMGSGAAIESD